MACFVEKTAKMPILTPKLKKYRKKTKKVAVFLILPLAY